MATERVTVSTDPAPKGADNSPNDQAQDRPEWLPEKFKTPEELARSYAELEAKLGSKTPDNTKLPTSPAITDGNVQEAARKAGVDLQALSREYLANGGKLSDDTVKALGEKGIPKEAVDNYIAGAQAAAQAIVADLTSEAGGADELRAIYGWATANLSAEEIEAYNAIVDSGAKAAAKFAFQGLLSRYRAATGSEGKRITGEGGGAPTGIKPFASTHEIVEAMGNPRYANDPAYRAEIEKRMSVTNVFGVR